MSNPAAPSASPVVDSAIRTAQHAKALFDEGRQRAALAKLAEAFPALANCGASQNGFELQALERWARQTERSQAERDCAAFVLHVADRRRDWGIGFDVMTIMERWNEVERAVFVEWAHHP